MLTTGPERPLCFGSYPTPVSRIDSFSGPQAELWIKNDGAVNAEYGGNKVRKLELLLHDALVRDARRIVAVGAAGSHQVLATALFAAQVGLPAAAVICPQPWSAHAELTLRASLAHGVELHTVGSMAAIATGVARIRRRGDYVLWPGGSSVTGTLGYVQAAAELAEQIRTGVLPEPDVIVAPLGSGGTLAGLLAGVLREGLSSVLLGVNVAVSPAIARALVLSLAAAATRRDRGSAGFRRLARQLEVDGSLLGPGYAHETEAGRYASERAAEIGLELDPTYTAKTFAKVLELIGQPPPGRASARGRTKAPTRVLYWHTLSAAPLAPLAQAAPSLPERLAALLVQQPKP